MAARRPVARAARVHRDAGARHRPCARACASVSWSASSSSKASRSSGGRHVGGLLREVGGVQSIGQRQQVRHARRQSAGRRSGGAPAPAPGPAAREPVLGDAGRSRYTGTTRAGVDRLAARRREVGRDELRPPATQLHLAADEQLVAGGSRFSTKRRPNQIASALRCRRPAARSPVAVAARIPSRSSRRYPRPRGLLLVRHQLAERPQLAEVVVAEGR